MKKILSTLLVLTMLLGLIPAGTVFATEDDWYLGRNTAALSFEHPNAYQGASCSMEIGSEDGSTSYIYSDGFVYQSNHSREWNGSATTYFTFTVPQGGYKRFVGTIGMCYHHSTSDYSGRHRVRIFVNSHQAYITPNMEVKRGYNFSVPVKDGDSILVEVYGGGETGRHVCFGNPRLSKEASPKADVSFPSMTPKAGDTVAPVIENCTVDSPSYTYKWFLDGSQISTNANYTVQSADIGKLLVCEVSDATAGKLGQAAVYLASLPVMELKTDLGRDVTTKETYIDGDMKVYGNSKYPVPLDSEFGEFWYDGRMEIRGRGNSSWTFRKKSYRIKLDEKAALFGMPESKHWVLLANCYDETGFRNKISYDFAADMGLDAPRSQWVYVSLNGVDLGVYQLCENVRIDEARVNIRNWEDIAEEVAKSLLPKGDERDALEDRLVKNLSWIDSGTFTHGGKTHKISDHTNQNIKDLAGGYVLQMEYDDSKAMANDCSQIKTNYGLNFNVKEPEYAVTSSEMADYLTGFLNAVEAAFMASDGYTTYGGKRVHYSDLVDMDSVAKYFLNTELFYNPDSGYNSNYMYKPHGGKLIFGPVWDYDCAMACEGGGGGEMDKDEYGSTTYIVDRWQVSEKSRVPSGESKVKQNVWYKYLIRHPDFTNRVYNLYKTNRTNIGKLTAKMDEYYAYMSDDGKHNSELWWYKDGYEKDFADAKAWLTKRIEWLDTQFASADTLYQSLNTSKGNLMVEMYDLSGKRIYNNSTLDYRQGLELKVFPQNDGSPEEPTQIDLFINGKYVTTDLVSYSVYGDNSSYELSPEQLPLTAGAKITLTLSGLNQTRGVPETNDVKTLTRAAAATQSTCKHPDSAKLYEDYDYDCGNPGYSGDEVCVKCGKVLEKGEKLTWQHDYSLYETVKKATYFEKGLQQKQCYNCGKLYKKEISKKTTTLSAKSGGYASVKLSWKKASGATGYEIWRKSGKSSYKKIKTVSSKTLSYTNKSLKCGTKYTYRIRPRKVSGGKTFYGAYVYKSATPVPAKPTLKVTAGRKKATLKLTKVSGTTRYQIYMSTKKGSGYKKIYEGKNLKYTKKSLKSKKYYYFKARVYKKVGSKKIYSSYTTAKRYKIK